MLCNFENPLQLNVIERGELEKSFSEYFLEFSVCFYFYLSLLWFIHCKMKSYYLCILFSKLSIHVFFPFCTAFEFCPLTFLKFSEVHHIKDSIWQGLDSIFDNILTVILSLTVAISNSPWISCCMALHIRQKAATLWRNIRACHAKNMNSMCLSERNVK